MMLKVFLLFILLIAGIVLGPMLAGHQGYVLIQTDNYNIETSVTGLVIILILGVVVLLAVEWILRRIFRTGVHTRGCMSFSRIGWLSSLSGTFMVMFCWLSLSISSRNAVVVASLVS